MEKIEPFVEAINKILQEDPGVHKEYILVRFHQFGDSSLDILMIYFTVGIRGHDYYGTPGSFHQKYFTSLSCSKGVLSTYSHFFSFILV